MVVACSALKKSYREILRGDRVVLEEDHQTHQEVLETARQPAPPDEHPLHPPSSHHGHSITQDDHPHPAPPAMRTFFVHPHGPRELLMERMSARKNHFMKVSMLDSQLQTLEDPTETEDGKPEDGTVRIALDIPIEEQVKRAVDKLKEFGIEAAT